MTQSSPARLERRKQNAAKELALSLSGPSLAKVLDWCNARSPYVSHLPGGTNEAGEQIPGPIPFSAEMSNIDVIAYLIARNGFRPKITGWGQFSGPFGLDMKSAFLLMELTPYLQGMVDCAGVDSAGFMADVLEPRLKKLLDEWDLKPAETAEASEAPAEASDVAGS